MVSAEMDGLNVKTHETLISTWGVIHNFEYILMVAYQTRRSFKLSSTNFFLNGLLKSFMNDLNQD